MSFYASRCRHHRALTVATLSLINYYSAPNVRKETSAHDHCRHHTSTLVMARCEEENTVVTNSKFWYKSNETHHCEAIEKNNMTRPRTVMDGTSYPHGTVSHRGNDSTDSENYYYKRMNPDDVERTSLFDSHAIFGALWGGDLIERYNIYQRISNDTNSEHSRSNELLVVDLKLGNKLNGHQGIIHGGIISLLFDEAMGWAYECLQQQQRNNSPGMIVVTANLTVDFRAPLLAGSGAVIRVFHTETKGRKIYFSARLESGDGSVIYAEATSLFILTRSDKLKGKDKTAH